MQNSAQAVFQTTKPVQVSRPTSLRNKKGDLVGSNYHVPKGNFARFLGWKEPSASEKQGNVSAARTLEVAIQQKMNQFGEKAMKNSMAFRNMTTLSYQWENRAGRGKDMFKAQQDAMSQSLEINRASNMKYLEIQYQMQMASMSFGTISNLMKTRSEATRKAITEVK